MFQRDRLVLAGGILGCATEADISIDFRDAPREQQAQDAACDLCV